MPPVPPGQRTVQKQDILEVLTTFNWIAKQAKKGVIPWIGLRRIREELTTSIKIQLRKMLKSLNKIN